MRLAPALLFLAGSVLCTSCAPIPMSTDPADYEGQMRRLEARLAADPTDAEALRDVGIIHLRTGQHAEAAEHLQEAFAHGAEDPRTLVHLGLASEAMGRRQTALRLYERYPEVSRISPYRRLMEGRYRTLSRQLAQEEIREQVRREAEIGGETSPRILAVVPFQYQAGDEQYAPLGRGLAEMLTIDLAKVPELQLVERVRLQALMDELELGQTGTVDPSTAPRMGRLLGAGRLVGGSYSVVAGGDLNVDAALVAMERANAPTLESRSGSLSELFRLQKEVAFALIDELGYALTPAQREEIERQPTQNLQAFLAFSRGLMEDDAGNFDAAAHHFEQANQLDPSFNAAAERMESAEAMSEAAGSTDNVIAQAARGDVLSEATLDLVGHRARTLGESMGANLVPGQDARKPFTDAAGAGALSLPDPPPPPARE